MARAFQDRLGDTDMASDAVQHAVNGVLSELERLWRADTEQQVSERLTAEISGLRAEIARRDAVDRDRPTFSALMNLIPNSSPPTGL